MIYIEWFFILLVGLDYYSKNNYKDTLEEIFFSFLFLFSSFWCLLYIFIPSIVIIPHIVLGAYLILFLINKRRNNILLHIDSLTQLFNRRLFDRHINNRKPMKIIAVYYIDVNDFKQINDQYGHEEGDRILKMVAEVLRMSLRKSDRIYRIGGDEFVVVAKITKEEYAGRIIQKINAQLEEHNKSNPYPTSLSIGYALTSSSHNLKSIVKKADAHMYENKLKIKK